MVQLHKHQTSSQMSAFLFHVSGQDLFFPTVKTPGLPDLEVFSLKRGVTRTRLAPSLDFRLPTVECVILNRCEHLLALLSVNV